MIDKDILAGIRVLDLSRALAGPTCAQMLADLGAEVIKVERPGRGDDFRGLHPALQDRAGRTTRESTLFLSANRNKQSITIDLAQAQGQDLVRRLAAQCDVLVENYKPGDLARHGLDHASLAASHPRLVYCSISGYGHTGPLQHLPGFDSMALAMSGFMSTTGLPDDVPGGGPMKPGASVADMAAGLYAAFAVLGALYARDRPGSAQAGRGQHIDLSLLDSAIAMMGNLWVQYLVSGELPQRLGTETHGGAPNGLFRCADGDVMLSVTPDRFEAFCGLIGDPALAQDPRFADNTRRSNHRNALRALIEPLIARRRRAEFVPAMQSIRIPCAPINDIAQAAAHPQVAARGMVVGVDHPLADGLRLVANPIHYSATPIDAYRAPPLLGQHTDAVLGQLLGLSAQECERLRADGVI